MGNLRANCDDILQEGNHIGTKRLFFHLFLTAARYVIQSQARDLKRKTKQQSFWLVLYELQGIIAALHEVEWMTGIGRSKKKKKGVGETYSGQFRTVNVSDAENVLASRHARFGRSVAIAQRFRTVQ